MKIKDIKEIGFYEMEDNPDTIFEVLINTDGFIIDQWDFDYVEQKGYHKGKRIYQTSGGLFSLNYDLAEIDVEKITNRKFNVFGNMGAFLRETIQKQQKKDGE